MEVVLFLLQNLKQSRNNFYTYTRIVPLTPLLLSVFFSFYPFTPLSLSLLYLTPSFSSSSILLSEFELTTPENTEDGK